MPEDEERHDSDAEREREREHQEREERISERVRRREERENTGARRFRPGPGSSSRPWQFAPPSKQAQEEALDHEIDIIANAVHEHGPLEVDELRRVIRARYWGPGRFRPAVRVAIEEGRVVSLERNRVGPPPEGGG